MKIVIFLLSLLLYACGVHSPSLYKEGDIVKIKLTGQKGMVVSVHHSYDRHFYNVRVVGVEIKTQTSIVGPDEPTQISPYPEILFAEFELEVVK